MHVWEMLASSTSSAATLWAELGGYIVVDTFAQHEMASEHMVIGMQAHGYEDLTIYVFQTCNRLLKLYH